MSTPDESTLQLRLRDGVRLAVPGSLSAITTYVALEQEDWFEKETAFLRHFLRPGMAAIDIGANLGLYSLRIAQLVGPHGRVFSYEPGGEARALFESSRALNTFGNLEISASALSDGDREGFLAFAGSTELRALDSGNQGEPVRITSLDSESAARSWPDVDFIKIDAEGEEERIIHGGRAFFEKQSPLVMFEVKAGDKINERLRSLFPSIGYHVFRQLEGAPVLVPDDPTQPLDGFELNLFAAKPDRISNLSERGLLIDAASDWSPREADHQFALSFWQSRAFAQSLKISAPAQNEYRDALTAYARWRDASLPMAVRGAALGFALRAVRAVGLLAPTPERTSTWARIAWEAGARAECVGVLQKLLEFLGRQPVQPREPFWPPSPRFDDIGTGDKPADWFAVSAAEQFERTRSFSSYFVGASPVLPWLCNQGLATAEMLRRATLITARAGQRPKVPERLRSPAPDHMNADLWGSGGVPGTLA
jgi:FkbM family methyltransferase